MATMHVELVSIEAPIWSGEATAVFGRTTEGDLGVLPGHTPLLGALETGFPVRIVRESGEDLRIAVHGGFLSVRKDGVSVLAEQAELASDIDVSRARAALSGTSAEGSPDEVAAHNRALARLRAAGEQV
ncbi:MAG: F0F1 ATP synthase subunit epsilon [Actinobacteria bacterium]|nr:F0F1 ATP synthase subunit epsilon [Actinomycetota bacterium]